MKKQIISIMALLVAAIMAMSFTYQDDPEPWPVPDEYKNMENPAESLQNGKMLYNRNCASCHGKKGLGDGPKARMLDTFSGDFSGDFYQNQTDGEHFYKTKYGRGEMPAYEGKISDEDIWHMVNYMRTFDK